MKQLKFFLFGLLFTLVFMGCSSSSDTSIYVELSTSESFIIEGDSSIYLFATITESISKDCTVNLTISGTATENVDYTVSDTQIIIPADETSSYIEISPIDDYVRESTKTISVDIDSILPTSLVNNGYQGQSILFYDDDATSDVTLTVDREVLAESNDQVILTLELGGALTVDAYVELGVGSDSDALEDSDFTLDSTTIYIESGTTIATTSLTSIADNLVETVETIVVEIDNVVNVNEVGEQYVEIDLIDKQYDFKTIWETSAGNSLYIGLQSGYDYAFIINWGDDTYEYFSGDDLSSIEYEYDVSSSDMEISITPTVIDDDYSSSVGLSGFPSLYLYTSDNNDDIYDVSQWGKSLWETMAYAFTGASNLATISATDTPNLTLVTDMTSMFQSATSFSADLSDWDMSNVTDVSSMFQSATSFNADLSSWDMSNVSDMSHMFYYANQFNSDISTWNTESVTDMSGMFAYASSFNVDISSWNVSNVEDFSRMFMLATSFNQNISSWNISSALTVREMFYRAYSFNQDVSSWDTSLVTNMYGVFRHATAFDYDLGDWDLSSVESDSFSMLFILSSSGISTCNYSETLQGWATISGNEVSIPESINLEDDISIYYSSDVSDSVDVLVDDYDWTILSAEDSSTSCDL